MSESCSVNEAISEIIDNIFDNFERKKKNLSKTNVAINIHYFPRENELSELIISENSGGIAEEETLPIVQLGASFTEGAATIGVWGQGLKISIFSLANEIEIFSNDGKESKCIYFENNWIETPEWEVPVFVAEGIEKYTTIFKLKKLKRSINLMDVKDYLEKIFSYKLINFGNSGESVSIKLHDYSSEPFTIHEVKPEFTFENLEHKYGFSYFCEFRPALFKTKVNYDLNDLSKFLDIKIKIGILRRSTGDLGGVYMYGNNRLFTPKPLQNEKVGFGKRVDGFREKIRGYAPPLYRLIAMVFFEGGEGESQFIPWVAPLKNDYNANTKLHNKIIESLFKVMYPYSIVCEPIQEHQLLLFSSDLAKKSETEAKSILSSHFNRVEEIVEGVSKDNAIEDIYRDQVKNNNTDITYALEEEIDLDSNTGTELPLSRTKASDVKKIIEKINSDEYDLNTCDFLIAFFTDYVNRNFDRLIDPRSGKKLDDLSHGIDFLPALGKCNQEYIKYAIGTSNKVFETRKIQLSAEQRQKLSDLGVDFDDLDSLIQKLEKSDNDK